MENEWWQPKETKPNSGRWMKGQSGNPHGRRRRGQTLAEAMRKIVDRKKLARAICALAYDGDLRAAELILNRLDGPIATTPAIQLNQQLGQNPRANLKLLSTPELEQLHSLMKKAQGEPVRALPPPVIIDVEAENVIEFPRREDDSEEETEEEETHKSPESPAAG